MAIKTFTTGEVLTASDTNTYLANSGLVYVGGTSFATASVLVDNVFTSTYRNYRIVIDAYGVSNGNAMRLTYVNSSGTEITSGYYSTMYWLDYASATTGINAVGGTAYISLCYLSTATTPHSSASCDITGPQTTAISTGLMGNHAGVNAGTAFAGGFMMGTYNSTTSMRGFYLRNSSATTMTGTVSVYGYRTA